MLKMIRFIEKVTYQLVCVIQWSKLKLEKRDFSRYNYLSLDSAKVNGVDDAANFRTVKMNVVPLLLFKMGDVILFNQHC